MDKVIVYSASWCAFCHQIKEWLKAKNIEFEEIDVEANREAAEEVVKATKQMGIPVTKIGEQYIVGFDRPKLEEALKAAGLTQ